jgi:hypothetical protein
MKTCPYCAEEVKEAAVVCRYCHKPLMTEVIGIDLRGKRFVGGLTKGGLGIWDALAGGPPVERFPAGGGGRQLMRERFRALEAAGPAPLIVGSQAVAGAVLVVIAGLLIVLGSFLPWITLRAAFVGTVSRSGMEGGDGIGTLLLGVVTVVIGVARLASARLPRFVQRSSIVTGGVTFLIAAIDYADAASRVRAASSRLSEVGAASVGPGLWTLFLGAIIAVVGGFVLLNRSD